MGVHKEGFAEALATPEYVATQVTVVVLLMLTVFGLFARHAALGERGGFFAGLGLLFALGGTMVLTTVALLQAVVAPTLAESEATLVLLDPTGPLLHGPFGYVIAGGAGAFAVGYIMHGFAIIRARTLSVPAGLMMMFAAPAFAIAPALPFEGALLASGLFGMSLFWLGVELVVHPDHPEPASHSPRRALHSFAG